MSLPRSVSGQDIAAARFPRHDVYDLVLEGFFLHSRGEYEMPPKQGVHTRARSFMHAMPAYLPTKNLAGTKLVSVYPDNAERGLDATTGIIVMMDPETGIVCDIVDAGWVTSTRTAMVSMVDAKFLAKDNPVFGIVGATGRCGRLLRGATLARQPRTSRPAGPVPRLRPHLRRRRVSLAHRP